MMAGNRACSQPMQRAVDELIAELRHAPLGASPLHELLPEQMRRALGAEIAGTYAIEVRGDGLRCVRARFAGRAGLEPEFVANVDRSVHYGALDWRCPPMIQRNRALYLPASRHMIKLAPHATRRLGLDWPGYERLRAGIVRAHALHCRFGIDTHRQLRTIVCDGAVALAWVGLTYDGKIPSTVRAGFARLIPAIRWRSIIEHRLQVGDLVTASLELLLERYAGAAVIRDRRGVVVHANRAAIARLDDGSLDSVSFDTAPLPDGLGELLLEQPSRGEPDLRRLEHRWQLTARQCEVLRLVLDGHTNRVIATLLDVTESTVEFHLSRIMDQAGVSSRAGLASEAWRHSR